MHGPDVGHGEQSSGFAVPGQALGDRPAHAGSTDGDHVVILLRRIAAAALPLPVLILAPPAAAQQAQQAPSRFMITAIDVTGVTRLAPGEVERLVYPFVGPRKSNDDVVAAQKALQDAYAAKGLEAVLVDVPVQEEANFRRGIVTIAVNESPVGRVRVVGARHHSLEVVRASVPSLVEGQPVDVRALQRDVAAANRFPDRSISPAFRAGQVPGTIDVELKVDDEAPYHASVEVNNDNSPSTEPLRLVASARYTDLWSLGHTLSATYSVAPQARSQSEVFSGSYTAPLLGTPWSVLIYGYHSNSNVAALGGTNVLGNGDQIGLRATYRLPSEGNFQQISFGPDFKAFKESIFLLGEPLRPTPIRYVPLVAEYTLAGSDDTTTYSLTLGATAGLRAVKRAACVDLGSADIPDEAPTCTLAGGGVGVPEDQFVSRAIDGRENFVHFNMDLNYSRVIPGNLVLALRVSGQLAETSLITNEQFSIGGMTNVRGYFVSEAVGDSGLVESVELQSPDIAALLGDADDELRLFAFGDLGYARVLRPALGQASSFRISSLGGGMRVRLLRALSGEFVFGVPLVDGPVTDGGNPTYKFSVRGEF